MTKQQYHDRLAEILEKAQEKGFNVTRFISGKGRELGKKEMTFAVSIYDLHEIIKQVWD